jgi:hypothetical protein
VGPYEVTGSGKVYSFTVNHQRWLPGLDVPYALVLVEFARHPGVRVMGRIRGCAPEDVAVGMPVEIGFEPGPGGFAIPSFVATAGRSSRSSSRRRSSSSSGGGGDAAAGEDSDGGGDGGAEA